MKIRKISLTLKHSAQMATKRGDRWVGMELSAEAELNLRERLGPAAAKLAEQLSAEFNELWTQRVRNGVPVSLPVGNGPAPEQASPVTAGAHVPHLSGDAESGQGAERA